ncbi:hypothetical protein MCCC1A01412_14115 [Bacillus anthracis]|nr:hypothetical protein MCCC1A01412_14115 [Bacillus anthracis]
MSVFVAPNVTNVGHKKFFSQNPKFWVRSTILPLEKLPLEKGVKHYEEIYRSFSEGAWILS